MNSEKKDSISEEKTEEISPEDTPVQDVLKKAEDPEKAEEKSGLSERIERLSGEDHRSGSEGRCHS